MKLPINKKLSLCLITLFFLLNASAREFTDVEGRTIDAELVSVNGDQVVLLMNAREYTLPISRFSQADIAYIEEYRQNQKALEAEQNKPKPLAIAGVTLATQKLNIIEVPLTDEARKLANKGENKAPSAAKLGIALPNNFDPAKTYPVLIINITSSVPVPSSINHMRAYKDIATDLGWVVFATEGVKHAEDDSLDWRWAMTLSGLHAMHQAWPNSKQWPVATGGFSGGAKWSGWYGGKLVKADYQLIGMFMSGCNEDFATRAIKEFKPNKRKFTKSPVFVSNGTQDKIASVASGERVAESLKDSGFRKITMETFDAGHTLHKPHIKDALIWFAELAELKLAPRS